MLLNVFKFSTVGYYCFFFLRVRYVGLCREIVKREIVNGKFWTVYLGFCFVLLGMDDVAVLKFL